jgi:hypothetical protein
MTIVLPREKVERTDERDKLCEVGGCDLRHHCVAAACASGCRVADCGWLYANTDMAELDRVRCRRTSRLARIPRIENLKSKKGSAVASALLPGMRRAALTLCLVCALGAPASAQTSSEPPKPAPELEALARQMPDCQEFRNACQVCVRVAEGKLGCSNIGVACSPSGPWHCSAPSQPQPTK